MTDTLGKNKWTEIGRFNYKVTYFVQPQVIDPQLIAPHSVLIEIHPQVTAIGIVCISSLLYYHQRAGCRTIRRRQISHWRREAADGDYQRQRRQENLRGEIQPCRLNLLGFVQRFFCDLLCWFLPSIHTHASVRLFHICMR